MTALWGQLVEAKEEEEEEEESIYWTMAERKRRLSKWFQNVLRREEEDEEVQCVCVHVLIMQNLSKFMIFDFPPMMDLSMHFLKIIKVCFMCLFIVIFLPEPV